MPVSIEYNSKFEKMLGLLCKFIGNLEFCISGSSVISIILGEHYDGSDIDFYVGYTPIFREDGSVDHEFEDFIVHNMGGVMVRNLHYQNKSCKYICPHVTLNIIYTGVVTKERIHEYICTTSDLDICTSTYDGEKTIFPISVLTKNASVINEHLIETTFESDLEGEERESAKAKFDSVFLLKRRTRQCKYINRGFKIYGSCLTNYEKYMAETYIDSQTAKEKFVRDTLKFIAEEVKKNVFARGNKCLDDILQNRDIFRYRTDVPIMSIHHDLDYEEYPWARMW